MARLTRLIRSTPSAAKSAATSTSSTSVARTSHFFRFMNVPESLAERSRKEKRGRLMHRVQHAAPAGPGRQMDERIEDPRHSGPETRIAVIRAGRIQGPVNQEGPAHDGVVVHKTPVAAVAAPVTVVAHGKVLAWRHNDFVSNDVLPHFVS